MKVQSMSLESVFLLVFVKRQNYVRAVGLGQATRGTKLRQKSVLQINNSFSNLVVFTNKIIVHDSDVQVLTYRYKRSQFEHSEKYVMD